MTTFLEAFAGGLVGAVAGGFGGLSLIVWSFKRRMTTNAPDLGSMISGLGPLLNNWNLTEE